MFAQHEGRVVWIKCWFKFHVLEQSGMRCLLLELSSSSSSSRTSISKPIATLSSCSLHHHHHHLVSSGSVSLFPLAFVSLRYHRLTSAHLQLDQEHSHTSILQQRRSYNILLSQQHHFSRLHTQRCTSSKPIAPSPHQHAAALPPAPILHRRIPVTISINPARAPS